MLSVVWGIVVLLFRGCDWATWADFGWEIRELKSDDVGQWKHRL